MICLTSDGGIMGCGEKLHKESYGFGNRIMSILEK